MVYLVLHIGPFLFMLFLGMTSVSLSYGQDYDRDPVILKRLDGFQVLVLCSSLQIMPFLERTEECFNTLLKNLINQI